MSSFQERQRYGKVIFLITSTIAIVMFLLISNGLVKELAQQERERMNIWARATERLVKAETDTDFDFLLSIISQNNSIPVMVSDANFNIIEARNFNLPDKEDPSHISISDYSDRNKEYLLKRLRKPGGDTPLHEMAAKNPHFIEVEIFPNTYQYIYYEDSILLRRLSLYPYIQLIVMIILALIIYLAVIYTKRAEQNRVWVGLSKETAHQLGTPISSLMAWNEYLRTMGADEEITSEIEKDVTRLSVIADRFGKIGSQPELQLEYINDIVGTSLDYMKTRIGGRVALTVNLPDDNCGVLASRPLFAWVMENITKNAVDAMGGVGKIDISVGRDRDKAWIEIHDTGKGIARKNFKNVFSPGFTTKKRGWGLGLTLVKRIIEEYHSGRIFVKDSELGKGTTFRIELPAVSH